MTPVRWALLTVVAVTSVPPVSAQVSGPHRRRVERIENNLRTAFDTLRAWTLEERMAHYGVPGVSVAVLWGGQIVWAKGYGVKNLSTFEPVEPSTIFQAASLSQPFAALAALRLVDQGVLDLDTDIEDYLTSWEIPRDDRYDGRPITLRALLSHTAGLNETPFRGYEASSDLPTLREILHGAEPANSEPVRPLRPPGEGWQPSGGGYAVLQQLLVDVTGQAFPQLMQDLVLDPLLLTSSTFEQPLSEERGEEAAHAHDSSGGPIEGRWRVYPEMAAAGLWTTPFELLRISIEVQRSWEGLVGTFLEMDTARTMLTPVMNDYGLGFVTGEGPRARFGHDGSNAGYEARWTAFVGGDMGVAVMANGDRGGLLAEEIVLAIGEEYGWKGEGGSQH